MIKKFAFSILILSIISSSLILMPKNKLYINAETSTICTYAVISNQSWNQNYKAYTGSFDINSNLTYDINQPTVNADLALNNSNSTPYKIDYVRKVNKNLLTKNYVPTTKSFALAYTSYQVGSIKTFWTYDFETFSPVAIIATLKSSGTKSNVWVKLTDYSMSSSDANKITNEFDTNIYPKITQIFALPSDVDNNGKIDILCYDIKDGFNGNGGYIAGYFDPYDLYPLDSINNPNTNKMEVFYIDTSPGMGEGRVKDVTSCYGTLAHEFQHMVNYNQNVFVEGNPPDDDMDTWLQEALSEAASQVYTGKVSQDRIDYYNSSSLITSGISLIVWDGELENYSLAYLFSQYLKEQAGIGDLVFKELLADSYNDYRAVENIVRKYINPSMNFGQFMTAFRAALFLKRSTGLYGFKGNMDFNTIKEKIYTGSTGISLDAGGAIVIPSDPIFHTINIPLNKGTNINYFLLQEAPVITINAYNKNPTNESLEVFALTDVGTLDTKSHVFSENGSYEFVSTNIIGDKTTKLVTIDNIDKTPPTITGASEAGIYNIAKISISDGTATINEKAFTEPYTLRSNGDYKVIAKDFLGNTETVNFKIANSAYRYSDNTITGIPEKSTVETFIQKLNLNPGEISKVFDQNNNEITNSQVQVGTGLIVRIYEGSTMNLENKVLIYGDIDGDSSISVIDMSLMRNHLLNRNLLYNTNEIAADTDKNGNVNIVDLLLLKKHLLGMASISQ